MLLIIVAVPETGEVFEYLYIKYKGLMLKKAYAILLDGMLAEDAVSEAFIRIYKNMGKLAAPDSPQSASFIYTVVKNVALTMRKREAAADLAPDEDYEPADSFNLEDYAISELSSERIYTLLNGVPEDLRSVFILKYAHDLSHREIGTLLHITENNVTVRLHRARGKIAEILRREGYAVEK